MLSLFFLLLLYNWLILSAQKQKRCNITCTFRIWEPTSRLLIFWITIRCILNKEKNHLSQPFQGNNISSSGKKLPLSTWSWLSGPVRWFLPRDLSDEPITTIVTPSISFCCDYCFIDAIIQQLNIRGLLLTNHRRLISENLMFKSPVWLHIDFLVLGGHHWKPEPESYYSLLSIHLRCYLLLRSQEWPPLWQTTRSLAAIPVSCAKGGRLSVTEREQNHARTVSDLVPSVFLVHRQPLDDEREISPSLTLFRGFEGTNSYWKQMASKSRTIMTMALLGEWIRVPNILKNQLPKAMKEQCSLKVAIHDTSRSEFLS